MAKKPVKVETLTHDKAARLNIPTAEYQSVAERIEEQNPAEPAHYRRARPLAEGATRERPRPRSADRLARRAHSRLEGAGSAIARNGRGRNRRRAARLARQGPAGLVRPRRSDAAALHPGEIHPKAIIDDLKRRKKEPSDAPDLFADFNGLDDPEARTEFYQRDQHWSNRFILGDSLAVMASLAEREGLRGKVQCILIRPMASSSIPTGRSRGCRRRYATADKSMFRVNPSKSKRSATPGSTAFTPT